MVSIRAACPCHDQRGDRTLIRFLRSYFADTGVLPCSLEPSVLSPSDAGRVPLIGTIPGAPGGYVATGHSVRAIQRARNRKSGGRT